MNKKCDVRKKNEQDSHLAKYSHFELTLLPLTNIFNKHNQRKCELKRIAVFSDFFIRY